MSAGISLKAEVDEIALGLDTAIPCGLIIIELLSNALKYAFPPPDGEGEIFIGLRREAEGFLGLTVGDNGVGLPADLQINLLHSLGLRLVSDLARYQLDGEMDISREKGTRVPGDCEDPPPQHSPEAGPAKNQHQSRHLF
jgi:two-component sensor histidine kinase